MSDQLYDVAVIGGGPAGSCFATYARQRGLSVVLFEKEKFPRDHVGESLIPFTYWRLKELGVVEEMKAYATHKPGVNFVDADGKRQSNWCFGKILKDPSFMTYHTLRAPFDHTLLKKASSMGATVLEEHSVKSVDLNNHSGNVTLSVENKQTENVTYKAKFLIDASGQNSFLAKRLGTKTSYSGLDRVAFFTHWKNTKYDNALKQGLIKIVYLGGEKKGWVWVIPVGRNHLSIGVSLNNSYVKEVKAKLQSQGSQDWVKDFYLGEILSSPTLREILEGANQDHYVLTTSDYSYYSEKKYGDNYAMIGDAGAFLDPIFSSGIYVAMETAKRVAECVEVHIKNGKAEAEKTFDREFATINQAYRLIEKFVRLFYDPEVFNFSHATPDKADPYERMLNAYNVFHYLLAGDFFSKPAAYIEFLDQVQNEKAYKRFIEYFKTKFGEKETDKDCGFTYEEIYGHLPEKDISTNFNKD